MTYMTRYVRFPDPVHMIPLYLYTSLQFCGNWENNIRSGPGSYIYFASRTQLTGQWVAGECIDGKMWYCDENLVQAHKPFTALVRNNKISKYVDQTEGRARVLFREEEAKAPAASTEEQKSAQ